MTVLQSTRNTGMESSTNGLALCWVNSSSVPFKAWNPERPGSTGQKMTDSSTPNSQVIEAFSLCMFLFCTFYQTLPSGPPLLLTTGAPAPSSSQDPVSLRSQSWNDSNTVSVLVSLMHLLQVHYRFFIRSARVTHITGHSRPPGGVGLTPRQYTAWNV